MKSKILLIVLIVAGLLAFNAFFPFKDYLLVAVEWFQHQGPWAAVLFFFFFVLCVTFFIPVSPLIMMAGTLYGFGNGYLLVAASGMAAVAVTYALGKKLWREKVEQLRLANPRFEIVYEAVSKHGPILVFLVRLNPFLPYSLLNYLFTIPKLDFRRYLLSSLLGMTPDILLYLYIGRVGRGWLDDSSGLTIWNWLILGAALLTTALAALIINRVIHNTAKAQAEAVSAGVTVAPRAPEAAL